MFLYVWLCVLLLGGGGLGMGEWLSDLLRSFSGKMSVNMHTVFLLQMWAICPNQNSSLDVFTHYCPKCLKVFQIQCHTLDHSQMLWSSRGLWWPLLDTIFSLLFAPLSHCESRCKLATHNFSLLLFVQKCFVSLFAKLFFYNTRLCCNSKLLQLNTLTSQSFCNSTLV